MSDAVPKDHIVLCHSCDAPVILPPYRAGYQCRCPRCHSNIRSAFNYSFFQGGVISISALLLLCCSLTQPFFSIQAAGLSFTVSLQNILLSLDGVWKILILIFALSVLVFPLLLLCILTLIGFTRFKTGRITAEVYSISHFFCFVDVFALAVGISLIKISGLASVSFYSGFYIYLIFSFLLIWCWKSFPAKKIWDEVKHIGYINISLNKIGKEQGIKLCKHCGFVFASRDSSELCPRCGRKTGFRKNMWFQRCLALLIAATVMFFPSNYLPVMFTTYLGNSFGSNIMDGALELFLSGSWFVSAVIIIASLFIPGFKIFALSYLIIKVKRRNISNPASLTTLFRIVEFIGKWSMLDVFVVIVMASSVKFYNLMDIAPGFAIIAFCSVVLLTLAAAVYFDERLIWDSSVEK